MNSTQNFISANKERFLNELIDLLKIPSISADPSYSKDVHATAIKIAEDLTRIGIDKVEVCETAGYPIVYGEKMIDDSLPTVLVYGHYDVQPADPIELWTSPAFEPVIKTTEIHPEGAIFARGACDDKGQMFMHVKAVESMLKANELPCNVKFMIEGEEEVGSENLGIFVTLNDENNHITIPGFYDKVVELSDEERAEMAKAPFSHEKYCKALDIADVMGEAGYSTMERGSIRPTLDVNGIWGGYTGEGAKTVIASKAYAKISMRLVPDQDPHEITELFKNHFESIAPASVKVVVKPHHGGEAAVTPIDSIGYKAASMAYEATFGKKPIPVRSGGSIPIVAMFDKVLGLKTILMGFGLDSDAIHSPNEHYGLFNFYKGIETIPHFYKHFTELSK